MNYFRWLGAGLIVAFLASANLLSQTAHPAPSDACGMPGFSQIVNEQNMFTEEQEEWLGEIQDQSLRKDFHIIEDPDARLQQLGERLLAQLPASKVHYRFAIIDSPELNSFGLAGGRIYIFRRMIAFVQSEDELAALLGHEIGHMITHQVVIDISRRFRALGFTSVGGRDDILNKWNQLVDNFAKTRSKGEDKREEEEQIIADRIGLYAMTRAGYNPAQFVAFADRSFETKGKTGGFWSDLFGARRPEYKRLREIVHNAVPMPASCIATRLPGSSWFSQWQQRIIGAETAVVSEAVPGLLSRVELQAPLREDLQFAQFSPDGTHVLAQDDSGIFVLTRDPWKYMFQIDAPEAYDAHFTPDSQSIVFHDKELRVQKWDLQSKQRASVHGLNATNCWGSEVSPGGDVLACAIPRFDLNEPMFALQLIDVTTGKPFLVQDKFYQPTLADLITMEFLSFQDEPLRLFNIRFSPDGRYVVVSRGTKTFAYDLQVHSEIKLPASIRAAVASAFTFLDSNKIAGVDTLKSRMDVVRFPSGEAVDQFSINKSLRNLSAAAKGDFVLAQSFGSRVKLVVDLSAKKMTFGSQSPALAIYDQIYAAEESSGAMVLGSMAERKAMNQIQLPKSPLGAIRAASFSPDGKWLAVSAHSGGAIWNVETGQRIFYLPKFNGAAFDNSGRLRIKFDKDTTQPARVVEYDPASRNAKSLYELSPDTNKNGNSYDRISQVGDALVAIKPKTTNWFNREYLLEIRDIHTNNPLWERKFQGTRPPYFSWSQAGIFTFVISGSENVKAAAGETGLASALEALDAKKDAYLVEAVNCTTGKALGAVLVDTGKLSFRVESATTANDMVLVADSANRTIVFSLTSGKQIGKVFGHFVALSADGANFLVENDRGVADLYETQTLRSLAHFSFPSKITRAQFDNNGKTIRILTADQIVYALRVGSEQNAQAK